MDTTEIEEVEILDAEKPIAAYNPVRAGIAAMAEKYGKTVFSVATTKDMEAAKAARAEVREVRYNVEKIRKALKAPALAYSKRIDDEAREYTEAILAIEAPIDELIKAEEKRKAEEKVERERLEREEALRIQRAIDDIRNTVVAAVDLPSETIGGLVAELEATEITLDAFGDRSGEAEIARQHTLGKLYAMQTAAAAREAEQKRLADERAELQRLRTEQEAREAEARAKAAKEDAERQAEIDRQQAEIRAQQEEIDRQRREVEAAKDAAEQAEVDRLAKIEAKKKAKRDAEEREAREKAEAEARAKREKEEAEAAEAARRERVQFEQNGPGTTAIIETLALHYRVHESSVIKWLLALDLEQTGKDLVKEFAA